MKKLLHRNQEGCWIAKQSPDISDKHPLGLFSLIFVSWLLCEPIPDDVSSVAVGFRVAGRGKVAVWTQNITNVGEVIRRPIYCQSWTGQWQTLEEHTWDSCSPEWRCLQPLCRTAWRCSQLESGGTEKQPYVLIITISLYSAENVWKREEK